jgi:hypothetical protein
VLNDVPNQAVYILLLCKNRKYSSKYQYNDVFVGNIMLLNRSTNYLVYFMHEMNIS